MTVVHYYDEDYPTDHELAPLCKNGHPGDEMTMFVDLVQCDRCEAMFANADPHYFDSLDDQIRPLSSGEHPMDGQV